MDFRRWRVFAALTATLAAWSATAAASNYAGHRVVRVTASNQVELDEVLGLTDDV